LLKKKQVDMKTTNLFAVIAILCFMGFAMYFTKSLMPLWGFVILPFFISSTPDITQTNETEEDD
jgi:hypothetical protein